MRTAILLFLSALTIGAAWADTKPFTLEEVVAGLHQNPPEALTRIDKDTVSNGAAQFFAVDRDNCVGGTRIPENDGSIVDTWGDLPSRRIDDALPETTEYHFRNAIPERTRIVRDGSFEDWQIEGKDVVCHVYHSGKRWCLDKAVFSRVVPGIDDEKARAANVDASIDQLFNAVCKIKR